MDNSKLRRSSSQIQLKPILQPRKLSIAEDMVIRDNQQIFQHEIKF